jgi:hypothetical protein
VRQFSIGLYGLALGIGAATPSFFLHHGQTSEALAWMADGKGIAWVTVTVSRRPRGQDPSARERASGESRAASLERSAAT